MKYLSIPVIITAIILGACSVNGTNSATRPASPEYNQPTTGEFAEDQTLLLVSLDDGTVIKQTIHSTADVCFKVNSESLTTCLIEGQPVIDPATNSIIGYQMIEENIELIAKTD